MNEFADLNDESFDQESFHDETGVEFNGGDDE